jgi:hypothetical protein
MNPLPADNSHDRSSYSQRRNDDAPAPTRREGQDDGFWRLVHELPPGQRADVLHRYAAAQVTSECSEETARRGLADALKRLQFETG